MALLLCLVRKIEFQKYRIQPHEWSSFTIDGLTVCPQVSPFHIMRTGLTCVTNQLDCIFYRDHIQPNSIKYVENSALKKLEPIYEKGKCLQAV